MFHKETVFYSISIIVLSFLSVVIFYEFPFQDFLAYEGMYLTTPKISNLHFSTFSFFNWGGNYGEFGFTLLNSLFKSLNLEYTETRFVIILLIVMSKLFFFKVFGNHFYYAVPLYFLLIFPDDASLLRAGIASSFIAWSFLAYYHFKNKYLYFSLIAIGSMFHISSILGIIFIFTSTKLQNKKYLLEILVLVLVLILLPLDSIYEYVYIKLSSFLLVEEGFKFFRTTTALVFGALIFYFFNRKKASLLENVLVQDTLPIILFGFVSLVVFSFSQVISDRLFGLTYTFFIALMASICQIFRPAWIFKIISGSIFLLGFYMRYI
jgi:hypothetical protein